MHFHLGSFVWLWYKSVFVLVFGAGSDWSQNSPETPVLSIISLHSLSFLLISVCLWNRFIKPRDISSKMKHFQLSQACLLVNLRPLGWICIQVFPFTWYAIAPPLKFIYQFCLITNFVLSHLNPLNLMKTGSICICDSVSHVMGQLDLSDRPLVQLHRPYFRWCCECGIQCWVGTCGASAETDRRFGK